MLHSSWAELPAPCRPTSATCTPFVIDLRFRTRANGNAYILKHFYPEEKTLTTIAASLCHGEPLPFNFGGQARNGQKALQLVLQKLGGRQYLHFTFGNVDLQKRKGTTDIDAGYDLLHDCHPNA